MTNELDSM